MFSSDERRAAFAMAWADQQERLDGALGHLAALQETAHQRAQASPAGPQRAEDEANAARLAAKHSGVLTAAATYADLDTRLGASDPAAAWRTYTEVVYQAWRTALPTDEHHAHGLALAASYQRGYAPDIDAPALISAHLLADQDRPGRPRQPRSLARR